MSPQPRHRRSPRDAAGVQVASRDRAGRKACCGSALAPFCSACPRQNQATAPPQTQPQGCCGCAGRWQGARRLEGVLWISSRPLCTARCRPNSARWRGQQGPGSAQAVPTARPGPWHVGLAGPAVPCAAPCPRLTTSSPRTATSQLFSGNSAATLPRPCSGRRGRGVPGTENRVARFFCV